MADITSTLAPAMSSMAAPPAPTPSAVYTPDPACLDPSNSANYWAVTTSCDLSDIPLGNQYNSSPYPDWLHCTVPMFGAPGYGNPQAASCLAGGPGYPGAAAQGEEPKTYYEGCPVGYAPAAVSSRPGYDVYSYTEGSFDISYYQTTCCPTVYPFQARTLGQGQSTSTSHDGTWYSVYVYPMPECYATSIKALSGGKELPMQTTSNTQQWDKKRRQEETAAAPEPTTTWNYEDGTLYALPQIMAHTVFMGTHTCYEDCSTWMQHYYPDGTGAPGERHTETGERRMPRPSETEGGGENNSPTPTVIATNEGGGSSEESNPVPSPTATATGSGGSGSESGGDDGIEIIEPEDPSDKESPNSQSPDVSLASRIRGGINVGSCSIVALMIPLLVATLVL
ncbi:hypothetical protein PG997_015219 [Apiospora hydei]|uniref:Uncharacterized protein n=1 Tax=Apiospora hydei TaxID=1337664 RepID=A0ABR1UQ10_9PEZI